MKHLLLPMISAALTFFLGSCQDKTPIFTIPEGHVGMFGYGSLMSKNLIETHKILLKDPVMEKVEELKAGFKY